VTISIRGVREVLLLLLLFAMILDPTRSMFRMTEIVFVAFLVASIRVANFKYLPIILFFYFSYFFSLFFNIASADFETDRVFSLLLALSFTFMLLFVSYFKRLFQYFFVCTIIMSVVVLALVIAFFLNKTIAMAFIISFRNEFGNILFTESKAFLSLALVSVFYKSSPIVILSLAYSLVQLLTRKSRLYLVTSLLLSTSLFFSGTRANIFAGVLVLIFTGLFYLFFERKKQVVATALLFLALGFSLVMTFLFVSQKGEASLEIKNLHQVSYLYVFSDDLLRSITSGFGPGSLFYSEGFGQYVASTELSYLELFRNYGLLNGIVIVALFGLPIVKVLASSLYSPFQKSTLAFSMLAYLFVAGTNPFLNSMLGYLYLTLAFACSEHNVFAFGK